jgi:hypothetical protein
VDADDLFGLPLDRFVAERTALAKELRARGQGDQAAQVAALRKPSLAAWAVNQLVRTQSRDVQTLFEAGDEARRAQAELLDGRGDGAALRDALDRERDHVSRLIAAARGLLSSEGHALSPAALERVAETLHAAALDEEARVEVERGSLERELRHVGIGAAGLSAGAAGEATLKREAGSQPKVDIKALTKAETSARRAAERAAEARAAAVARRESAAEALSRAETAVAEADKRAREAEAAQRRARRELDRARRKDRGRGP